MKTIAVKTALVSLALGVAVFALAGTASATLVNAVITVPDEATVGQPTEIQARLLTAGESRPVAGTDVTFYADASFAGVTGEVQLGRAVTDEDGIASLTYEPKATSVHEIRIEYLPPGEEEPAIATTKISVIDDGAQLHRSSSGVDIPGLNVWLIMAVVATVWSILLSVALRVIAIARAGDEADMVPAGAAGPGHTASRSGQSGAR